MKQLTNQMVKEATELFEKDQNIQGEQRTPGTYLVMGDYEEDVVEIRLNGNVWEARWCGFIRKDRLYDASYSRSSANENNWSAANYDLADAACLFCINITDIPEYLVEIDYPKEPGTYYIAYEGDLAPSEFIEFPGGLCFNWDRDWLGEDDNLEGLRFFQPSQELADGMMNPEDLVELLETATPEDIEDLKMMLANLLVQKDLRTPDVVYSDSTELEDIERKIYSTLSDWVFKE